MYKNKNITLQVIENLMQCQQTYPHSSAICSRFERYGKHQKSQRSQIKETNEKKNKAKKRLRVKNLIGGSLNCACRVNINFNM